MAQIFNRKTHWIWLPKTTRSRNSYACFRRTFSVKGPVRSAVIHITADSRYELYVNGHWLGHGPIRAFPALWPVDTYDIRHLLVPGKNVVAVFVHHFGISTFQYLPANPGLIAEVDWKDSSGSHVAPTDRTWKCIEHEGYAFVVPRISCQQGWEEQFNANTAPGDAEHWAARRLRR